MTRASAFLVVLLAAGCAHAPVDGDQRPAAVPVQDLKTAMNQAYERATALLYERRYADAAHVFETLAARARTTPDESEAWVYNALTWVRWGAGDLDAALAENQRCAEAIKRAPVSDDVRRGVLLHYWWDRAYLLLDVALAKPAGERAAALAVAGEARREYERLARQPDQHDGLLVLAAYFAARTGDREGARSAARQVDVAKDDDLQDLYVIALALDMAGEHADAVAVRQRIASSKSEYPMKPLIIQQIARDRAR